MTVSAIVARAANGVIGHEGGIPWYLPADLQFFKRTTLGHAVIMGRKCFESIGRPLPKRTNIIITRNPFYVVSGCIVVHSIAEALEFCEAEGETEAMIIGGADIYRLAKPWCQKLYLTEVECTPTGDTFFEWEDLEHWTETWAEHHAADEKNEFGYTFKSFERQEK